MTAEQREKNLSEIRRISENRASWEEAIARSARLHRERVKAGLAVDFDVVRK